MHLLGKSYKVWMETPTGDSIPLIDIPQWHFEWQFYYRFLSPIHVPAGTVFKTEGVYDNTIWNPLNPNDPPQEVTYGSLTTDEMFLVYFIWADHEEGDEDLVFGTVDEEVDAVRVRQPLAARLQVAPNPAASNLQVTWNGTTDSQAVLRSLQGGVVWTGTLTPGVQSLSVQHITPGTYVLSVQSEVGQRDVTTVVVQR